MIDDGVELTDAPTAGAPRSRRGRPSIGDDAALAVAEAVNAERVARGERPSDRLAVQAAIESLGLHGASEASLVDRLRRKLRARRRAANFVPLSPKHGEAESATAVGTNPGSDMARAAALLRSIAPAKARTSLDDFEGYVAERTKLRTVAAEYEAAVVALRDSEGVLTSMSMQRAKAIDEAAFARLEGRQAPLRAVTEEGLAQLRFDEQTLREALRLQTQRVEAEKAKAVEEILREVRPEHQRLMQQVLDATVALSEALDEEEVFRIGLVRAGISQASLLRAAEPIRQAVGSRARWASGVNALGRAVSKYLGRGWDHSAVGSPRRGMMR